MRSMLSWAQAYGHAGAVPPLIGTIVEVCTISNAMGLILVHRPSMRKKSCFHTGTGRTGGRFIAPAVMPASSMMTPAACAQTTFDISPITVSSCAPSGFCPYSSAAPIRVMRENSLPSILVTVLGNIGTVVGGSMRERSTLWIGKSLLDAYGYHHSNS
ncbi:hypothetical protein EV424DRAFT_1063453 [Suillus variegatus]|nr:hypothetical protein EV424DRAFT_1063453 [Suillus variegatus]